MYISNEILNIIDIISHGICEKKSQLLKKSTSPLIIKAQQFKYSFRLRQHEYINYNIVHKQLIQILEKDGIIIDSIVLHNYKRFIDIIVCNRSHTSYSIKIKFHIMNRELLDTHIRKNLTSDSI